jgi:hypothetical protein
VSKQTEQKRLHIVAGDVRVYPTCCTSAYCGRAECGGCRNLPVKAEFEVWREAGAAVRQDRIWCPSVWTATRDQA